MGQTSIALYQNPATTKLKEGRIEVGIPYASARSGTKAREEISKILKGFGCESVGFMDNHTKHELILAFTHRGRNIQLTANAEGWASSFLKDAPFNERRKGTRQQYEQKALDQGVIAVNSILRDWVKGQVTAIETGILSFDHVFMPYMMLADGRTVLDHAKENKMLPSPQGIGDRL